jgi:ADP-ribosyl-[dinitrogen reductase] hydrolase
MLVAPINPKHKNRAIGCLVGQAVGDALGAPYEFGRPGAFDADNPPRDAHDHFRPCEMKGGGSFGWEPAEFTDDTQMAWVLAKFLLDGEGGTEEMFQRWKTWSRTARDVGGATGRALSYPNSRESFVACSKNPEASRGNGVVMRVSPVGIAGSVQGLKWAGNMARAQAMVTHHDPRTVESAVIAAVAMAGLISGEFTSIVDAFYEAVDQHVQPEMRAYFFSLFSGDGDLTDATNFHGDVCLRDAFWSVSNTTNYEDAVRHAINLGGDADTVGAVAGALAGAMYGMQRIPAQWATKVHGYVNDEVIKLEDLQRVAANLSGFKWKDRSPDHGGPLGPKLVHPAGVYAANLSGVEKAPNEYAVVSLCRTFGATDHFTDRTQFYLIDETNSNPDLGHVVAEAINAINAYIREGLKVIVHCHAGRSRTGLVLKAWYMHVEGVSHKDADEWLEEIWPHYAKSNSDFTLHLNELDLRFAVFGRSRDHYAV